MLQVFRWKQWPRLYTNAQTHTKMSYIHKLDESTVVKVCWRDPSSFFTSVKPVLMRLITASSSVEDWHDASSSTVDWASTSSDIIIIIAPIIGTRNDRQRTLDILIKTLCLYYAFLAVVMLDQLHLQRVCKVVWRHPTAHLRCLLSSWHNAHVSCWVIDK